MKKFYPFLLLIILCNSSLSNAQSISVLNENNLWLVNQALDDQIEQDDINDDSNFFNFNPILANEVIESEFQNILTEYFTLFIVYKADAIANSPIATLSTKKNKINITSNYANLKNKVAYENSAPTKGVILSYKSRFNKFSRKNELSFKEFLNQIKVDKKNNQLIEVILFTKILNSIETSKIESYLSIKYGISLIGKKDYVNSKRDTIWSYKKNRDFNHRVTSIGRDDAYNLYQKQSKNNLSPKMVIGLSAVVESNSRNDAQLPQDSFVFWGDNNKSIEFPYTEDQTLRKIDRVWKIQTTTNNGSLPLDLEIKIDSTFFENNYKSNEYPIWLAINTSYEDEFNLDSADFYSSTIDEKGAIVFKDIILEGSNTQSHYFTFFKAAPFFLEAETIEDCGDNNTVTFNVYGGQEPFNLEIENGTKEQIYTREFDLSLDNGSHRIILTDNLNERFVSQLVVENKESPNVSLSPIWELGANNQVEVIPIIEETNESNLDYTWYLGETIISKKLYHTFRELGNFELSVSNEKGCEFRYPIEITNNVLGTNGSDVLFPNPVQSGDPFTLAMSLQNPSEITLNLFNVNGQLLSSEILPKTSTVNYQHSFLSSGTYFIAITTNKGSKTYKVLVR